MRQIKLAAIFFGVLFSSFSRTTYAAQSRFTCLSSYAIPHYGSGTGRAVRGVFRTNGVIDVGGTIVGSLEPYGNRPGEFWAHLQSGSQEGVYVTLGGFPNGYPAMLPVNTFSIEIRSENLDCGNCDRGCCYVSGWLFAASDCLIDGN